MVAMAFELPPLPYPKNALEPHTSAQTLDFHHGRHHQAYVTNLNNLVKDSPMESQSLNGMDSLLSTVQMPGGIPVGTLAIGKPGATNAALLAVAILANQRPDLRKRLHEFREEQAGKVMRDTLP